MHEQFWDEARGLGLLMSAEGAGGRGLSVFKRASVVMSASPLKFLKPPTKWHSFSPSHRSGRIISRLRRGATGRRGVRRNVAPAGSSTTSSFSLFTNALRVNDSNKLTSILINHAHLPSRQKNRCTAFKDHCGNFAYLTFTQSGSGVFSQLQ